MHFLRCWCSQNFAEAFSDSRNQFASHNMSIVVGCILMCSNTRVIIIVIENHKLFSMGTPLPQPARIFLLLLLAKLLHWWLFIDSTFSPQKVFFLVLLLHRYKLHVVHTTTNTFSNTRHPPRWPILVHNFSPSPYNITRRSSGQAKLCVWLVSYLLFIGWTILVGVLCVAYFILFSYQTWII